MVGGGLKGPPKDLSPALGTPLAPRSFLSRSRSRGTSRADTSGLPPQRVCRRRVVICRRRGTLRGPFRCKCQCCPGHLHRKAASTGSQWCAEPGTARPRSPAPAPHPAVSAVIYLTGLRRCPRAGRSTLLLLNSVCYLENQDGRGKTLDPLGLALCVWVFLFVWFVCFYGGKSFSGRNVAGFFAVLSCK